MTTITTQRDRQFARLLCARAQQRASGILTASRGRLRRLFCLEKGSIVFATSNLVEEQFIEFLVRTGVMSPRMRAELVEDAARAGVKPIAYLIRSGNPSQAALRRGMEGLVSELITSTLEWPEGQFQFDEGLPQLDDEVTVRLTPRTLVLAHAKRYPAALDALRVRIGPPDFRPVAAASASSWTGTTELDDLGAYLLARCDGRVELQEIVKGSPADEPATLRAIYGFLLAGLLDPEGRDARREREAQLREDDLSREECLGRLAMASGQDHYGVLGVDKTARIKVIREAYYALARRYHPDRFRSGPLADLLPRFEDFFMQVTDAHNTLSDPMRRSEYDDQLAAELAQPETKDSDTGYLAKQNFLRGRALASQRKFTEAVTFFENAISLDPGQADYHLELGLVLSRNPRHREAAERQLLQAIDLSPTTVAAYVALGQMYFKAGRAGRAGRMAREALRWEPGHIEAGELLAAAGGASDDGEDIRVGVFGSS
jgi:tetratricopeptide (TPR) repeat protein